MIEKIRKGVRNAIDWYSGLVGIKKLQVTIILVIVLALLAFGISKVRIGGRTINYKDINYESIINMEKNSDKNTYIMIDTALKRLILASYDSYNINGNKINLKDFYDFAKEEEYSISKGKYTKKISEMFTELQKERNGNVSNLESFYPIAKNIYTFSEENKMYFIELDTEKPHIIGLHFKEGNFYIFYLE